MHDGAGLSDATDLNGEVSNSIYTQIDYDLLSIGNHELYETDIAYETFSNFSKVYGEKYLTSNVEIINKATGEYEPVGHKYRYFTTKHGLRIMSFGVLFDFTGNSEVSRMTTAKDMVQEDWFVDAVNYEEPIDLFVVIGHNPVRRNDSSSTFGNLYDSIREMRPEIPIQAFGGHTHIRDFVVYDSISTGLESGQYCETLGWLAMTGIDSDNFNGTMNPQGVPNPTRRAVIGGAEESQEHGLNQYDDPLYARRYLDWNRLTFAYHAVGSQDLKFDTKDGVRITDDITNWRSTLNLSYVYGCAPETYCMDCKPFGSEGNIYKLLEAALAEVVVNETRADVPRLITLNTGSVRFDLVKGPFTHDDSYIVSPFPNAFQFIPDVPYSQASQVLQILNNGPHQKRATDADIRDLSSEEVCVDPPYTTTVEKREYLESRSLARRQVTLTPGLTTVDDFGTDGDDTPHTSIPYHAQPNDFQAQVAFPEDGSDPETVDMVFIDFIGVDYMLPALNEVGGNYTEKDIQYYLPEDFTSNSYIQEYAKIAWQEGMPNCPVGDSS